MKKEFEIFIDLIKESVLMKEIKINDLEKLELIVSNLDLNRKTKIEKIGNGTYSNVYKVGNKVLKIGLAKLNERIISHSYIIKTYLKTNLLIETKNMPMKLGIEIQDLAEQACPDEEELYDLYKNLRDDGIIWHDIKQSNTAYFNDKLVVIDTDFIFYFNETTNFCNDIDLKFDKIYNNNEVK